ncbi:energy coupling factor transporter S component ThiW [Alkaliphilus crotonatoxidans]
MNLKKLTAAALLSAMGTATAHLFYIPVGAARCFPIQHTINLLSATLLGPAYGTGVAFTISLLRNFIGTGSLLAFPGSILGVWLAAVFYKRRKKLIWAMAGELVGTGFLGALAAYPLANYLMGNEAALFFFVGPFMLSSLGGVIIGFVLLNQLKRLGLEKYMEA